MCNSKKQHQQQINNYQANNNNNNNNIRILHLVVELALALLQDLQ